MTIYLYRRVSIGSPRVLTTHSPPDSPTIKGGSTAPLSPKEATDLRELYLEQAADSPLALDFDDMFKYIPNNSGSGASFCVLMTSNHSPYILKYGHRVDDDCKTFVKLKTMGLDAVFVYPVKFKLQSPAFHITPFIADATDGYDFWETHPTSQYGSLFKNGMGRIIQQFQSVQVECLNPDEWFEKITCAEVLNRIQTPALTDPDVLWVNSVSVKNGLKVLSQLASPPKTLVDTVARLILYPRFVGETVSDPNPLNELIRPDGTGIFIDPGTVRNQQLAYVLCKHDGPFALAFSAFMKKGLKVERDCTGASIFTESSYYSRLPIHDVKATLDHIRGIEGGDALLSERPFFFAHFLFYAGRQFYRDMGYAIDLQDTHRVNMDWTMGAVVMAVAEDTIIALSNRIIETFQVQSQADAERVITTPALYEQLNHMCVDAYESVLDQHPLYKQYFLRTGR